MRPSVQLLNVSDVDSKLSPTLVSPSLQLALEPLDAPKPAGERVIRKP